MIRGNVLVSRQRRRVAADMITHSTSQVARRLEHDQEAVRQRIDGLSGMDAYNHSARE